jgi:cytochrome P450
MDLNTATDERLPFDLLDPAFVNGDPHPSYAWLRTERAVAWDARHAFWVISRYDDIVTVSRMPEQFTTSQGTLPKGPNVKLSMLTETGAQHTRLRRIAAKGFTPAIITHLEARMREVARASVQAVSTRGSCDFLQELAAPLPLVMITEMLGISPSEIARFQRWSSTLIGSSAASAVGDNARGEALLECIEHFREILSERRERPRDDIMTKLAAAAAAGLLKTSESDTRFQQDTFADDELMQFMILLVVSGHESSRNMIARAMHALLTHSAQLEDIRRSGAVSPTAVEELLRWCAPSGSCRTAVVDAEVGGKRIRAGERVFLLRAAANRDPAAFTNPDVLDLQRSPNPHLTFGQGEHYCFGATIARAQIRVLLDEALRGLPGLRLAPGDALTFDDSPLFGIQSMKVLFGAGGTSSQ